MYGFLANFSCPEYIFDEKYLFFCFVTTFQKSAHMSIFSTIALFHINSYFIGKVSPMYGFLAGFSSPESIFAEKITYLLFCRHLKKNRKYVKFFQNRIISHQLLLHR